MNVDVLPFETVVIKVESNDEGWRINDVLEHENAGGDFCMENPIDVGNIKVEESEENSAVLGDSTGKSGIKEEIEDAENLMFEETIIKVEKNDPDFPAGENQENGPSSRDFPIDIEEIKVEGTSGVPSSLKNITGASRTTRVEKFSPRNDIKPASKENATEEDQNNSTGDRSKTDSMWNTFKCDKCEMEFVNASSLATHSKKYKFSCDVCPKCFISRQGLWYHLKTHYGPKPFKCEVCPAEFELKSGLVEHSRSHAEDLTHSCTICSYKTRYKGSLNRHMRVHTREKPFSCKLCPAKFREQGHLKRHSRIHTGEKRYTCDVCSAKFREKSTLRQHIIIHTGEKPYTCSVCAASFRQQNHLDRHMVVHSGERTYACEVCSLEFHGLSRFADHVLTHNVKKE